MIGRIVIALVLLLVGLIAIAMWRAEWIREDIDGGYNWKAARDDTLAARRYLEQRGITTRALEVRGLGFELPPAGGALVFLAPRLALSEAATASLDAWVRAGGQLLTLPSLDSEETLYGRKDALMRELGVATTEENDEDDDAEETAPSDGAQPAEGTGAPTSPDPRTHVHYDNDGCAVDPIQRLRLPSTGEELSVWIPSYARMLSSQAMAQANAKSSLLTQPTQPMQPAAKAKSRPPVDVHAVPRIGAAVLADEDGMLVYTAPYGRGRVTFVVDGDLWQNENVGCLDHAHLLWRLLGPARVAWFVTVAEQTTLSDLVLRHGKPLLVTGGALLLLWLWRAGQRFGPVLPSPQPQRRERMESLRAAGEYLWRQRAITDLLVGARVRVRHVTRRRFGHDAALAALARRAQMAPERAEVAMNGAPNNERDLIATTRTLQELIDPS